MIYILKKKEQEPEPEQDQNKKKNKIEQEQEQVQEYTTHKQSSHLVSHRHGFVQMNEWTRQKKRDEENSHCLEQLSRESFERLGCSSFLPSFFFSSSSPPVSSLVLH